MYFIATVWKNPLDLKKVKQMVEAGANVLRIKFARISNDEVLNVVREIKDFLKKNKLSAEILLDMPEEKISLGTLSKMKEMVNIGKQYKIRTADLSYSVEEFIPIKLNSLEKYFRIGDKVWVGDGELQFVVDEVSSDKEIIVHFMQFGQLYQNRGVFSGRLATAFDHSLPVIKAIPLLGDLRPDYLGLSFVDGKKYINNVRKAIRDNYGQKWMPKIAAKIESPAGLENLEEIIDASDMLIVARGDLALTTDYRSLILQQKRMCRLSNQKHKPVVVATQILDSCLQNSLPNRADLADVTNIIFDGADGFWFSEATAHSENPGEVIRIAKEIIDIVKENKDSADKIQK